MIILINNNNNNHGLKFNELWIGSFMRSNAFCLFIKRLLMHLYTYTALYILLYLAAAPRDFAEIGSDHLVLPRKS